MKMSPHLLGVFLLVMIAASGCNTGSAVVTTTVPTAPTTVTTAHTTLAVGEPYRFFIHCGMRYIRNIDGRNWETDESPYDGVGPFPDELRQAFLDPNEAVSPVVLGSIEITAADTLVFRARNSGLTVVSHPTGANIPGCA